jgi:hypothetical protein
MAADDALRVQVRLTADLHPELFAALACVRPRGRADRLRQLALLGLTGQRFAAPGSAGCEGATERLGGSDNDRPVTADPKRTRILGALTLAD